MKSNNKMKARVLFICERNVGRSQMAGGFYSHFYGKGSAVSAGIIDVGGKYNYIPRSDIIDVMREKGIDISKQKIKLLTRDLLCDVKNIVVLCNIKLVPDYILNSGLNIVYKEISDPFMSNTKELKTIRDQIERIVKNLWVKA